MFFDELTPRESGSMRQISPRPTYEISQRALAPKVGASTACPSGGLTLVVFAPGTVDSNR
jgi:hypothetical protein